ncbi:hypothetical protein ACHAXT_008190 [Thalassiosira profunda]
MEALGMNPNNLALDCNDAKGDGGAYEWLVQKLSALSSVTQQGDDPDAMLGSDAVLLARLLLEEQLLDGGRSNGRGGKYGGVYHPSTERREGSSNVGSRPLTVGEIYANWSELRDVTRMKYPAMEESAEGSLKRQDPLPKIRQQLRELYSAAGQKEVQSNLPPTWQFLTHDILFDYSQSNGESMHLRQGVVLLLGHDAHIPLALQSLSLLGCDVDVASDVDFSYDGETRNAVCIKSSDGATDLAMKVHVTTSENVQRWLEDEENKKDDDSSLLLVVPKEEETQSSMIEQIVASIGRASEENCRRDTFVMHSSLEVLRRCKRFLGEDPPLLSQGLRTCVYAKRANAAVSLLLPEWSDNVHPADQNVAEMDPWMNTVSDEQFLELVSARITAPLA